MNSVSLSLILASVSLAAVPATPVVKPGPVVEWPVAQGGNGHYYQAFEAPNTIEWPDANTVADSVHGYLATISSEAENNFVFHLVDAPKYWANHDTGNVSCGPWLGGQRPPGGRAVDIHWVHGEGAFTYTNWARNQPDNHNSTEPYLQYFATARDTRTAVWNDAPIADFVHGFIVEYDVNPLPAKPAVAATPSVPHTPWALIAVTVLVSLLVLLGLAAFFYDRQAKKKDDFAEDAP